ncbi:MAG: hypothetical protein U5Q44_09720 [Dehalococcoidia bacterium]|nr:hypothetical protein [Dehalococcoidia bacterium]
MGFYYGSSDPGGEEPGGWKETFAIILVVFKVLALPLGILLGASMALSGDRSGCSRSTCCSGWALSRPDWARWWRVASGKPSTRARFDEGDQRRQRQVAQGRWRTRSSARRSRVRTCRA